ncbi:MAG TPA: ankyrin repeat domain-containing protein [Castellaniella sp.]|nr:ankyrin repeat domain-containing protein [Castellaniella sp.]
MVTTISSLPAPITGLRRWALLWVLLCLMVVQGIAQAAQPTSEWWSAIRRDDLSTVQGLLLRGVDPQALNSIGNPALTQAIREQSWRVYDVLRIAPGVNVDQANRLDETPLMYLCILGETQRAVQLIAAGAQINRLGWTPLHYAASKARVDTARMLIKGGAIVNAPGPDGTTPLMMAALSGKTDMVRLLLDHGADATMFNAERETAADWALRGNNTILAEKLRVLSQDVARKRQDAADGKTTPQTAAAPKPEAQAPDTSSFSRYFDLDRFEDPPAGQ